MTEIFNFSGIELLGFILILDGAILIEEKIDEINVMIEELKKELN